MLSAFYQKEVVEAGCDEVGRGCLAGPVVAAAVILPAKANLPLLNDSKQLTETMREQLVPQIKAQAVSWAIAECSPLEIDEINILKASFLAMHRAIDKLEVKPEFLLIDGNRFTPYPFVPHHCIVKGDSKYASIAAASVLAKSYRDELMRRLALEHPGYGWERNVGYPTAQHRQGILAQGITPWHRRSFKLKVQ
jgi:ribonuclease HII